MNPSRSTRTKEAIKTGLAMVLVYGIALQSGWLNPHWAGIAVAMISLATAGQSIHKGLLRLAGTIPGCVMALLILSLAPQSRWLFIMLTSAWLFIATYLMLVDKKRAYMWNVSGFVCLIIVLAGPSSSENAFEHAIFRTMETVLGVVVYTLVSVFLWPRGNAGTIKKAAVNLVATQARLVGIGRDIMTGPQPREKLAPLQAQEIQQLEQLAGALQAEGSESHEVHLLRQQWNHFYALSEALMEAIDSWGVGFTQLSTINVGSLLPDLPDLLDELDSRFEHIQRALNGDASTSAAAMAPLTIDTTALQGLPSLDRAALAVAKKDLANIEWLTRSMLACAGELDAGAVGSRQSREIPTQTEKREGFAWPVLDPDHLRGAMFAALATFLGFLVWVFVNPPGHAGWFELSGILAMAMAATQQMKPITLVKPVGLACLLCLGVYVFILPGLSTFLGLGSLLFVLVSINCYIFTGLSRLAGMIAIINVIAIQNQQSYNFAAMANSMLFMVMVFFFLFALSYLFSASRPEKALLKLSQRYFRSITWLVQGLESSCSLEMSGIRQWKNDFHRYEINTLPGKIASWGRAIDHQLFPANSPQQIQALVTSLEVLSVRVETLLAASDGASGHKLISKTRSELQPWLAKIESSFGNWSVRPETGTGAIDDLQNRLAQALNTLEGRIDRILEQVGASSEHTTDGERYFRLLGGLRGVSEAAVGYAGAAGEIDWAQWREERFS